MIYFKLFDLLSDYETYISGSDFIVPNVSYIIDTKKVHYNKRRKPVIDTNNYLTMVALEDGLTASLSLNNVEYCTDGDGNWKTLTANTETESINKGQTLSFRGELTPIQNTGIGTFTVSKQFNLEGNCMSLLFKDDAASNFSLKGKASAFYDLFKYNEQLVSVSKNFLPATTLAHGCYNGMFQNCDSLTVVPELPATTLEYACYEDMFRACSSLTIAPELPATTITDWCYANMFYDCESLTSAPKLPAIIAKYCCYNSMFKGCSALTIAPELPATTVAEHCYDSMFSGCSALTVAPELPAMILKEHCYDSMFSGCSALTVAPELPASTLATYCYSFMFQSCTGLTVAPELPAMILKEHCYDSMFSGCSALTVAPELPASTLATYCYGFMFSVCKNLNHITMLATDISASNCLKDWVKNVSQTGTFVKNPAMTSLPTGSNGIPEGWNVEDAA